MHQPASTLRIFTQSHLAFINIFHHILHLDPLFILNPASTSSSSAPEGVAANTTRPRHAPRPPAVETSSPFALTTAPAPSPPDPTFVKPSAKRYAVGVTLPPAFPRDVTDTWTYPGGRGQSLFKLISNVNLVLKYRAIRPRMMEGQRRVRSAWRWILQRALAEREKARGGFIGAEYLNKNGLFWCL